MVGNEIHKCILGNPDVTHSVPTAFITNAVGTEWVTPGLPRTPQIIKSKHEKVPSMQRGKLTNVIVTLLIGVVLYGPIVTRCVFAQHGTLSKPTELTASAYKLHVFMVFVSHRQRLPYGR